MTDFRKFGRNPSGVRGVLFAALFAVFLVRLFATPGFMPERQQDGTITLSICSETGSAPAFIHVPISRPAADHEADSEPQHCPFTVAGHIDAPATPPSLAAVELIRFTHFEPLQTAVSVGTYSPLPPSTGPPALTA